MFSEDLTKELFFQKGLVGLVRFLTADFSEKFMAVKKTLRTLGLCFCFFRGNLICASSSCQKTGLKIQVVVARLELIGLALGFLAPSGAKAKVRSNLAKELRFWGVIFWSVRISYGKGKKISRQWSSKCCGDSGDNFLFWITMLLL